VERRHHQGGPDCSDAGRLRRDEKKAACASNGSAGSQVKRGKLPR
jgi:hypothetical protein